MKLSITRIVASALAFLLVAPSPDLFAQKKQTKRKAPARRAPAPPQPDIATGGSLEERLRSLLNGRVASNSEASIQIAEVESGRVVAERNPHMAVTPASNMKLFTTGAALDLLEADFQVTTTVYARGAVDASGMLTGDVRIVGRGDPSIGGRFHDGNATAVIEQWATDLKRSGIKTVSGDLVLEYGYFDTEYVHPTWPEDQLINWYEAPISSFSLQEGCVQIRVLPGRAGQPCVVQLQPSTAYVTVENTCVTGRGLPFITRRVGSNTIIVRGGVPARSGATEVFISVENPVHYFAAVTNEVFARNGLRINGRIVMTPRDARQDWRPISQHSTPMNVLVYVVNKKSQNHYAEQVAKILAAERTGNGSWAAAADVIGDWLTTKVGVPAGEFRFADGSGMSRDNRASANSFIQTLLYMWKTPWRQDFVSSMPYTGDPDSKFGNRLDKPPYARQVYAKTGYISGVVGLSGYVHAQSGKVYAFSFLFNRYRVGVYDVYRLQDELLKEIVTRG
ncbi:MAG TPA: D-alanyl-D-alanine carboxypeptidase/D-alanyl-D-alanine-endopeptidase [Thermoanaerobaculia bacterium]|nr:D-alanyl-D-alanine carboxypeptidase/D-alanyl-D-alanine-endopeptidase [Thermoanaerobaculia bacterium]